MLFVLSLLKNLKQTNQRKNLIKYTFFFFQKLTTPPQFPLLFFSVMKSDQIIFKKRLVCPKPDYIFSAQN